MDIDERLQEVEPAMDRLAPDLQLVSATHRVLTDIKVGEIHEYRLYAVRRPGQ